MARHSHALRAVVTARGYVDPSALVLRVRGLAVLRELPRALRLLWRGKINPIKTLLKRKTPASAAAARILEGGERR
jgi:succinate dehydrogenase / fumarate reductase iron-sulfur subunit